jgi:hypothetical protein
VTVDELMARFRSARAAFEQATDDDVPFADFMRAVVRLNDTMLRAASKFERDAFDGEQFEERLTMTAPDNPRHPGPNPIDIDAASASASMVQALSAQTARVGQVTAFQSACHDTAAHDVTAGPGPEDD